MNNKKRLLTLLVELDENDKPHWIWDSHIHSLAWNGIYVKAICEGNQLKDLEDEIDDE